MKVIYIISYILLIIGGIDWGLVGLGAFAGADWNVIHLIFAGAAQIEWIIYILVGIAALIVWFGHKKYCRQG